MTKRVPLGWTFALALALTALSTTPAAAQTEAAPETTPTEAPQSPFEQPAPSTPSPFEQLAATVTATPAQPQPQPAAPAQGAPVVTIAPAPMPAPAPPFHPRRPDNGVSALSAGIALLVVGVAGFGIGGGLAGHWDACEWEADTYQCGRTGAYLASMVIFGFASAIALGGLILVPIGAVRLARSRSASRPGSRLAGLSPFAAPTEGGGAVIGLSGILF